MIKILSIIWGTFIVSLIAAYVTNLYWIFLTLSSDISIPLNKVALAIICLFPPIGAVHGYILWFGGF